MIEIIVELNGINLYYDVNGGGTPIIFIPGLGATHTMFEPQVEYFKKKYQVITLDLRGNGKSGKLNVPIRKGLETQAKDVKELMDYLDIKEVVFVGVSYGGIFLQKFYSMFSERVKALIIVDSFSHTHPNTLFEILNKISSYNVLLYYTPRKWMASFGKKYWGKRWGKIVGKEIENIVLNMRRRETVKQRLEINSIDFRKVLPKINVPTLGIVGNHTKTGVKLMKDVIYNIQNGKLIIFKDSFDPSNLCQPDKFNRVVDNFLSENNLNI
ncbi:putative hydrolase [Gottschalkia purinilytica]|uniref:Putative hydrolase n=1 Tax=Gottschalkia purinilytica TaxID=1503 RepID=A0A0L0W9Z4_GOTPU|nr:alpha/beta hydrolase [Gottschalkia purinilytica]KNF08354.1 putative hydrolase [Gottschalkia purinilytica]